MRLKITKHYLYFYGKAFIMDMPWQFKITNQTNYKQFRKYMRAKLFEITISRKVQEHENLMGLKVIDDSW